MTYVKTYLPTLKTHVVNLNVTRKACHVTSSGQWFAVNSNLKLSNEHFSSFEFSSAGIGHLH